MVVSSSYGGDFKMWVHNDTSKSGHNFGWGCHSVGSYKGQLMTAAAFSADGSVLAVAAGTVITLWDPDTNYLVGVVGKTQTGKGWSRDGENRKRASVTSSIYSKFQHAWGMGDSLGMSSPKIQTNSTITQRYIAKPSPLSSYSTKEI